MKVKEILIAGALAATTALPSHANPEFDAGVAAFRHNDFKSALFHFQKARLANPHDANTIYYEGVTYGRLGNADLAKKDYAILVHSFPDTDAGRNATTALGYLDPVYLRQLRPGETEKAASSATDSQIKALLPQNEVSASGPSGQNVGELVGDVQNGTVYFENVNNNLYIPASIDNRPMKMIFDSGAHGCTIGLSEFKALGLKAPEGNPNVRHGGVGSQGTAFGWMTTVTLKVGPIEKRNFPLSVMADSATPPLLGQTFFKEFNYSIDNAASSIRFSRKSSQVVSRDSNCFPFRREGNHIIIDVLVNGRPIACYLDTGAAMTVFSRTQAQQMGISIPDDAPVVMSHGIAGTEQNNLVTVNSLRCGPISKNDFQIAVSPSALPHPLLGQTFIGNLRYDIDEDNHLIRMRF